MKKDSSLHTIQCVLHTTHAVHVLVKPIRSIAFCPCSLGARRGTKHAKTLPDAFCYAHIFLL